MKKLMMMMLLTMTIPTWSQSVKMAIHESGSGNGNLDRDVLDYQTKLDEAQIEVASLEEAFNELKTELKKINDVVVPTFSSAGDDFWNKLPESDRESLLYVDELLIQKVTTQIQQVSVIKEKIMAGQAANTAFSREASHYEERGMKKQFKREVRDMERKLKDGLKDDFVGLVESLEVPILKSTFIAYLNISSYLNRDIKIYGYGYSFKKCLSAPCLDLMFKKYNNYLDLVVKIEKIKVSILGIKGKLGRIASGYLTVGYKNDLEDDMHADYFKNLSRLNQVEINRINN